jgi:hypothetical protein
MIIAHSPRRRQQEAAHQRKFVYGYRDSDQINCLTSAEVDMRWKRGSDYIELQDAVSVDHVDPVLIVDSSVPLSELPSHIDTSNNSLLLF